MTTILTIPGRVHGLNGKEGLINLHYRDRARLKEMWTWLFLSQAKGNRHAGKVEVIITRYGIKIMEDFDNLACTMKIPMDAVKNAHIIKDDKMRIIGIPEFRQVRVASESLEKYVMEITDVVEP